MAALRIDAHFPSGNIILDKIDGCHVHVHADLRDTKGDFFYWHFRVRGAQGRTLTFHFTRTHMSGRFFTPALWPRLVDHGPKMWPPLAAYGPAFSTDGGKSWRWLGKTPINRNWFSFTFAPDDKEVHFCLSMNYLQSDLRLFLDRHRGSRRLKVSTLCRSEKGRRVELLRLGRLDGKCLHRVALTCRHHCCEMAASHVMEGLMEFVLTDSRQGRWLRENVELLVAPFVDKDGVEDGDQGKNRRPHDHNGDYRGKPIYASTAAIRKLIPLWSDGKLRLALDLHCPMIRLGRCETVFFYGGSSPLRQRNLKLLRQAIIAGSKGPLPISTRWCHEAVASGFSGWVQTLPGVQTGSTIEIPYANAAGSPVTAESARQLGADLARGIKAFLSKQ